MTNTRFDARRAPSAILDEEKVIQMRALAAQGIKPRDLAQRFQLSVESVRRVLRGDTWSWVGQPPASAQEIAESEARMAALIASIPQPSGQDTPSGG